MVVVVASLLEAVVASVVPLVEEVDSVALLVEEVDSRAEVVLVASVAVVDQEVVLLVVVDGEATKCRKIDLQKCHSGLAHHGSGVLALMMVAIRCRQRLGNLLNVSRN